MVSLDAFTLDFDLIAKEELEKKHLGQLGGDNSDQRRGKWAEESRTQVEELVEVYKSLLDDLDDVDVARSKQRSEMERLRQEIEALRAEDEQNRREMVQCQEKAVFVQDKIKEMKAKIQNKDKEVNSHQQQLEDYCRKCEEFLGLKVMTTTDGKVIVEFNQLGNQTCLCELQRSQEEGDDPFTVVRCEPNLDQETIIKLEENLLKTNELNSFVVTLRKKFKEHLKK